MGVTIDILRITTSRGNPGRSFPLLKTVSRVLAPNERKVKKPERETYQKRTCNLHKQQVFIRERRPERDPQPSELHSERGKDMLLLQAGVFKHPVVGKGRLEGDGHQKK
jgi:hypothetical protein